MRNPEQNWQLTTSKVNCCLACYSMHKLSLLMSDHLQFDSILNLNRELYGPINISVRL